MKAYESIGALLQEVEEGKRQPLTEAELELAIAAVEQEEAAVRIQRKMQAETHRILRKEGKKRQKKEHSTFYSQLPSGSRFFLSCKDEALKSRSGVVYQKFNNAWARVVSGVEEETKRLLLGDWKVMSPEFEIIPAKG